MLPVVDKPVIQYAVEEAVQAGLHDILIVTSRSKKAMEDHFDRSPDLESDLERAGKADEVERMRSIAELADIHYVRQPEALGLGHAVAMAREHVGEEPFAVLLPDDLFHERFGLLDDMIAAYEAHGRSIVALKEVDGADISLYGCAAVDAVDGRLMKVTSIVEKPDLADAPSRFAVVGRYVLAPEIFDALDKIEPGKGGEIQLTDAIAILMERTGVYGWTFRQGRYDTGNKLDWLRANVEFALDRPEMEDAVRAMLAATLEDGPRL
jgi:UTP--glucose-1-phosphate uridylyltransferase